MIKKIRIILVGAGNKSGLKQDAPKPETAETRA
jgi:hypothetical protein